MNVTPIEWTTFSANPLKYRDASGRIVWGCVHASDGCRHCYSEALAKRYGRGEAFTVQAMNGLTPFMDADELRHMLTAKRIKGVEVAGGRCFVGDMTDLFGEWVPDELLDQLFAVFALRQDVTFQVLTKRADRARRYLSDADARGSGLVQAAWHLMEGDPGEAPQWPLPNVWLGVSVEDQANADRRIPELLATPAAVRFVSYEPGLGPVDFESWLYPKSDDEWDCLRWVIVGGESGPGARAFDIAWARSTVEQCKAAGVAVFVKQLGSAPIFASDMEGGPQFWPTKSKKGGDPAEWPKDLRVREFPQLSRPEGEARDAEG